MELQLKLLEEKASSISPKALETLAKNIKNHVNSDKVIEIFWNIYNYETSTFIVRSSILNVLAEFTEHESVRQKINEIASGSTGGSIVHQKANEILRSIQTF